MATRLLENSLSTMQMSSVSARNQREKVYLVIQQMVPC